MPAGAVLMDDDDDLLEVEDVAGEPGDFPILAVSYFDSADEMRGQVAECWLTLQAARSASGSHSGGQGATEGLGLEVAIDAALECALHLYPLIDGNARVEWGLGDDQPLFQLSDDGAGWIDPEQLWAFVEYLLDDILPLVSQHNLDELLERFSGGRRSLQLCDPSGRLLEMPVGFSPVIDAP